MTPQKLIACAPWQDPHVQWVKGKIAGVDWFSDYAAAFRGCISVDAFEKDMARVEAMYAGPLVRVTALGPVKRNPKIVRFSTGICIQARYFHWALDHFERPTFHAKKRAAMCVVVKEHRSVCGCIMRIQP